MDVELEAQIMERLRQKKEGQTVEQLAEHLHRTRAVILVELNQQLRERYVSFKDGVWKMVRSE